MFAYWLTINSPLIIIVHETALEFTGNLLPFTSHTLRLNREPAAHTCWARLWIHLREVKRWIPRVNFAVSSPITSRYTQ